MTPEGKVKKEIKEYLDSIGAYHYWPVPMGYGAAIVDCLGCYKGRFFAIEAKRPGGKATTQQEATLNTMRAADAVCFVADNLDIVKYVFWTRLGRSLEP